MAKKNSTGKPDLLDTFERNLSGRHEIRRHSASAITSTDEPPQPALRKRDLSDVPGNHRSAITTPGYHTGRKPGNWGKTYVPEPVTPQMLVRIVGACGGGATGCRDRALYTFLFGTAARISEALDLMPSELDLDEKRVTILCGKGGKRRNIGLSEQTIDALRPWLAKRAALGIGDDCPVFCVVGLPTRGKRLYSACVREQLRDAVKRAGIKQRITPHSFRHGQATYQMKIGTPLNVISKILGHSNSAVTARYLDHVDQDTHLDAIREMTWDTEAAG